MQNVLLAILLIAGAIFAIRRGIPGFFWSRACSHQDRGEYEAAERWFLKALSFEKSVQRITGQEIGVAHVCSSLGFLYHRQGRNREAITMFSTAIKIFTDRHRINESAPLYASLGKVYFDSGDLQLAEDTLNKALSIYHYRTGAQKAIGTITALLDLISERRQSPSEPTKYTNTEYGFSFTIPAEWFKQRLVPQFSSTGGQVAISHKSHKATFNVSVGPLDRLEWRAKETRASAVRDFLARAPGRIGSIEVTTSTLVGGEANTVSAEYETHDAVRGVPAKFKNGLISIVHNGLEYVIQWQGTLEYEDHVKAIIASFLFES